MDNFSDFLPDNYEAPKGESAYMKFKNGENRFRILSKPIIGWLDWDNKKPLRFPMDKKPSRSIDPEGKIKHFWAMVVWDYSDGKVKILEITQATIQSAIQSLSRDSDWGSPFDYDLKVTRKGENLETEYITNPAPKKPVHKEVTEALLAKTIHLEALFSGDDPFANGSNGTPPAAKKKVLVKMEGNNYTTDWIAVAGKISNGSVTVEQVKEHYILSEELEEELVNAQMPF